MQRLTLHARWTNPWGITCCALLRESEQVRASESVPILGKKAGDINKHHSNDATYIIPEWVGACSGAGIRTDGAHGVP